jgi:cardiolipin synthase
MATYLVHEDPESQAVAHALRRAADRGVSVRVVVDGFGSLGAMDALHRWWDGSSVEWMVYRPLRRWWNWLQPQQLRRLHCKLWSVDGQLGFIGGINLVGDQWDPVHGHLDQPRLDFAAEVEGPVVAACEQTILALWHRTRQGADWREALRRAVAPAVAPSQSVTPGLSARTAGAAASGEVAFVLRDNLQHRHSILAMLVQACSSARTAIDIVCPYFFPGRPLRAALCAAARRGVRVRLLLQGRPDYRLAAWAASALYRELLQSGVEIHEYTAAALHAKVVRVDEGWSTVGSANWDPLSLWVNQEANLAVRDVAFTAAVREAIERALEDARQVELHAFLGGWMGWRHWWIRSLVAMLSRIYLRMAGVRSRGGP